MTRVRAETMRGRTARKTRGRKRRRSRRLVV
jgi:hypothetical protein